MKSQNNLDAKFKKAITESERFYSSEADEAKERIWNNVKHISYRHPRLFLIRTLAAACILLFISTTAVTILNIKANAEVKTLITEINTIKSDVLFASNQATLNTKTKNALKANTTDTIYIEKEVIVSKPIATTTYRVDTVFIEQVVYVEKEKPQELITSIDKNTVEASSEQYLKETYEKKIVILNNEPDERKKRRNFQLKLGGNKNQANNRILAFTTKL